jgi:excinuclease UvrABC nuclease subunit
MMTFEDLEAQLMDKDAFKPADVSAPTTSGIYCIRIDDVNNLPEAFRRDNIIYIGKADGSKGLSKRLDQELRGKGHGTLFRGLGAVLGFRPARGSSKNNNYTFSPDGKASIIQWITTHTSINWVGLDEDVEEIEELLIKKYRPVFNNKHNPDKSKELEKLRKECRRIARAE